MEAQTFTCSPTVNALWRNNCTKHLLPISSRLSALRNDALERPQSADHCDHVTPWIWACSDASPPVVKNLLLQVFQDWSLRSMNLRCSQQGPGGLLALLLHPEGMSLRFQADLEASLTVRGPSEVPNFWFMPLEVTLRFFAYITQGKLSHGPCYKEERQQPQASKFWRPQRWKKSPHGQHEGQDSSRHLWWGAAPMLRCKPLGKYSSWYQALWAMERSHHGIYWSRLVHGKWLDGSGECFVHCDC